MISVRGLDHVVLRVRDMDVAVKFYEDVIGLTVERKLSPDMGLVQLRAGAALVDLIAVDRKPGRAGGGVMDPAGHNMDHFCLDLDPFDEAGIRAHLEAHGVECGETSESRYGARGYGPSIYIRDLDGNTIELKGPPTEEA